MKAFYNLLIIITLILAFAFLTLCCYVSITDTHTNPLQELALLVITAWLLIASAFMLSTKTTKVKEIDLADYEILDDDWDGYDRYR